MEIFIKADVAFGAQALLLVFILCLVCFQISELQSTSNQTALKTHVTLLSESYGDPALKVKH